MDAKSKPHWVRVGLRLRVAARVRVRVRVRIRVRLRVRDRVQVRVVKKRVTNEDGFVPSLV